MVNGEWWVVNGEWRVASGEWRVKDDRAVPDLLITPHLSLLTISTSALSRIHLKRDAHLIGYTEVCESSQRPSRSVKPPKKPLPVAELVAAWGAAGSG